MDEDAQSDELMVLSSIFEEHFKETTTALHKGGELAISIDLPSKMSFYSKKGHGERYVIEHLPAVYLNFEFPLDYPSKEPPNYTLSCKWLRRHHLTEVCQQLDQLWKDNEGSVIVYLWSQYIKEETCKILDITNTMCIEDFEPLCEYCQLYSNIGKSNNSGLMSSEQTCTCGSRLKNNMRSDYLDIERKRQNDSPSSSGTSASSAVNLDGRAIQDIGPKTDLMRLLCDYDRQMRLKVFRSSSHECKVCFCEKLGSSCIQFWPCGHVYCKECMQSYFMVQIKEGNIKELRCPTEKCSSDANPKQVEELVPRELYERWEEQLLSSTLSAMGDTQPCPRQHCQYPVIIEDNRGHCPHCAFVFCALCRFGEHGLDPCKIKNSEAQKILKQYSEGDVSVRKALEDRFGKKYLTKLYNELQSMNYIADNTKKCPKCRSNIEKRDGCNKMACKRCGALFCWLCGNHLDPARPYHHFNAKESGCFNRLFEGVEDEQPEVEDDLWLAQDALEGVLMGQAEDAADILDLEAQLVVRDFLQDV